ncbi:frizzled-3-like [Lampetra fluviatilis]
MSQSSDIHRVRRVRPSALLEVLAMVSVMVAPGTDAHSLFTCEPVTLRMCQDLPYNTTFMPNMLGHYDQIAAAKAMEPFHPLVNLECSPELRPLLCAAFAPPCGGGSEGASPCRPLCRRVLALCSRLADVFGVAWPDEMDCERFPDCDGVFRDPSHGSDGGNDGDRRGSGPGDPRHAAAGVGGGGAQPRDFGFWCPRQLRATRGLGYRFAGVRDCAPPCHPHMFFGRDELALARYFIGAMAAVCLCATLFAVLTFLIDVRRFRYPERPIVFYSLCYLAVALCYLVGFVAGSGAAACNPPDAARGTAPTVTQGSHRRACTLLFALLYFFTLAGAGWWVVLTVTWFLAAGLKWGSEAIAARAPLFHGLAWGLPGAQTTLLLALGAAEGDPVSGVCFVGVYDTAALRWYLLAPLGLCVAAGLGLLLAGFVSVNRVRLVIQHDARNQEKLVKFMIRVGVFSALYLLPLVALLGCYLYEQANRGGWELGWLHRHCQHYHIPCPAVADEPGRPDLTLVLVRYLMTLLVGIPSVFWVGSRKTCSEWASFFHRRGKRDTTSDSQQILEDVRSQTQGQAPATAAAATTPAPARDPKTPVVRKSRGTSTQGGGGGGASVAGSLHAPTDAGSVPSRVGSSYHGSLHRSHDGRRTPGSARVADERLVYCSLPRMRGGDGAAPGQPPHSRPPSRHDSLNRLNGNSRVARAQGGGTSIDQAASPRSRQGSRCGSLAQLSAQSRHGSLVQLAPHSRQGSLAQLTSHSRQGSLVQLASHSRQGSLAQLTSHSRQGSLAQLTSHSRQGSLVQLTSHSRQGSLAQLTSHSRQGSLAQLTSHSRQGSLAQLTSHSRQGSLVQLASHSRQGGLRDESVGAQPLSRGNSMDCVLEEDCTSA